MERAKWNNQFYYALEIAEAYELEKSIRKASTRKELLCPDPDCNNPILRYCRGEIKGPYFAHLDNCNCDYAEFDKGNTQLMRKVKHIIYNSFISQGYTVELDMKILPRHYTHLLFTLANGKKVALELGTQRTTAIEIEKLFDEYEKFGIDIKWIVINNGKIPVKENKAFFLKRYSLNESKYKDVLILNWDGTEVTQYVVDPHKYMFAEHEIPINNYSDIYSETGALTDLRFEDDELTLAGFHKRYAEWMIKKKKAYENKIAELEDEIRKQKERRQERRKEIEEQEKRRQEKLREIEEQERQRQENQKEREKLRQEKMISNDISRLQLSNDNSIEINDIRFQMLNSKEPFYDGSGYKLRLCLHCDQVKRAKLFDPYTFYEQNQNLGLCKECKRNNIPKKI